MNAATLPGCGNTNPAPLFSPWLWTIDTLQQWYKISTDWSGSLYCGVHLAWDYQRCTVDLSMPGYLSKILIKYQHPHPHRQQDAPSPFTQPEYDAKQQMTPVPNSSYERKRIQQLVGALLYYARAVNSTMLHALSALAIQVNTATQLTAAHRTHLLDYAACHAQSTLWYVASNMVLYVHSDASYLTEANARSRYGGHFFLANKPAPSKPILHNGTILANLGILAPQCHVLRCQSRGGSPL